MLEQRIQQHFFDSADLQYRSAEVLLRPIADAAAALLSAITSGGKVMVCGSGAGAALAQHLARLFTGRFERDRPPLFDYHPELRRWVFGRTWTRRSAATYINQAKNMTIVVLAGRGAAAFGELLAETDVLVAVPAERNARVAELQMLVLHCLCDAVDFQLMGDQAT